MDMKATKIDSKVPDDNNLATKAVLNTSVTEIENKVPNTTGYITIPEL